MQFVHAPFYALFMVGPSAVLIEIAMKRRASRRSISPPNHPVATVQ